MRDRIIQLQESAEELGFGTIQQALDAGYHEVQDLVKGEFKLEKVEDLTNRAYREAHEAWLKEREEVFEMIDNMKEDIIDSVDKKEGHPRYWVDTLERIRAFVEKGEV